MGPSHLSSCLSNCTPPLEEGHLHLWDMAAHFMLYSVHGTVVKSLVPHGHMNHGMTMGRASDILVASHPLLPPSTLPHTCPALHHTHLLSTSWPWRDRRETTTPLRGGGGQQTQAGTGGAWAACPPPPASPGTLRCRARHLHLNLYTILPATSEAATQNSLHGFALPLQKGCHEDCLCRD